MSYIQDKTFEKEDFSHFVLPYTEYDNCTFTGCNFERADLSAIKFIDCLFNECNVSLSKATGTAFRNVRFISCKMLGLRLDECNDFGLELSFDACQLKHSSFYGLKLKKTVFKNTQLEEVDFSECDLTEAVFNQCDLKGAVFHRTVLIKTDFRTSDHYSFDPELNKIKKAKFSVPGVLGLLSKYDILIER